MAISKRMQARIDRRNAKTTHKVDNPDAEQNGGPLYFPIRFTDETGETTFIRLDAKAGDDIEVKNLDIMPFIIGGKYPDKTLIPGEDEAAYLQYSVHKFWGEGAPSVICPRDTFGKIYKCPICDLAWEAINKAKKEGVKEPFKNDATWNKLKPKKRILYNAIDLDAEGDLKDKIQLFETSYWQFHKGKLEVAAKVEGKKNGSKVVFYEDLFEGYSLEVVFNKDVYFDGNNKNPFYEPTSIVLKERDYEYGEERYDEAIQLDQLMDVLSYETLLEIVQGDYSAVLKTPAEDEFDEKEDSEIVEEQTVEETIDNVETSDDQCPNGMVFGSGDFMTVDACHECALMEACGEASEPEQTAEPEVEPDPPETKKKKTGSTSTDTKSSTTTKRKPRAPRTSRKRK